MIDPFLSSMDFCNAPELSTTAREAVLDNAEAFFQAGGVLSLSDWMSLSVESKAAFIQARERHDSERVVFLATALGAPELSVSTAYSILDGGQWRDELVLSAATDRLIEKVGV